MHRNVSGSHRPDCPIGKTAEALEEIARELAPQMVRDLAGLPRWQRRLALREFERETGIRVKLTRVTAD